MAIKINPTLEAYLKAKRSGLYSEDELNKMLQRLEVTQEDLNPVVEIRESEGTKPVTTLKTIEDEEMSLQAPGGPIMTQKQRNAAANLASQVNAHPSEKKG